MSKPHTPEEVAEVSAKMDGRHFAALETCVNGGSPDVREYPVLTEEGLVFWGGTGIAGSYRPTPLGRQVLEAKLELDEVWEKAEAELLAEEKAAEWEEVAHEKFKDRTVGYTARLPVPGGWLYRTEVSEEEFAMAAVFVPDPEANR